MMNWARRVTRRNINFTQHIRMGDLPETNGGKYDRKNKENIKRRIARL